MSEEKDRPVEASSANTERPPEERRARRMIAIGAVILFLGIALAVMDDDIGRWFIIAGVGVLFSALHRFGRLGPEDATA
jgi:hypothetical protein